MKWWRRLRSPVAATASSPLGAVVASARRREVRLLRSTESSPLPVGCRKCTESWRRERSPVRLTKVIPPVAPRWSFYLTPLNGWVVRTADATTLAALLNVSGRYGDVAITYQLLAHRLRGGRANAYCTPNAESNMTNNWSPLYCRTSALKSSTTTTHAASSSRGSRPPQSLPPALSDRLLHHKSMIRGQNPPFYSDRDQRGLSRHAGIHGCGAGVLSRVSQADRGGPPSRNNSRVGFQSGGKSRVPRQTLLWREVAGILRACGRAGLGRVAPECCS